MKADLSAVVVRRMRTHDLDHVVRIADGLKQAPHWPQSAYLSAIDPTATPQRIGLVAEAPPKSSLVGFAVASLVGTDAELETIAVAAGSQRHGIGGKLVAALIDELKAAGAQKIILEVRESNQKALALYKDRGWQETGRRKRYYTDPEEDAVLMELALS